MHPKDIDPNEIPFIFKNKEYTKPANQQLLDWMRYFAEHDVEVLRFLFNKCQYYVKHGGCSIYTWATWQKRLHRDLKNTNPKEF